MSLGKEQRIFSYHLGKLLIYAYEELGYEVSMGEAYRSDEQQALHLRHGRSKVKRSKHQDKLAVDLNLFIDGVYQTDSAAYKKLGDYWKSLSSSNFWGGDWKKFKDGNHFQRGK